MPLPRYQPVRKKPKVNGLSLDDLDDYCLSKIIGHALSLSSCRDGESTVRDNGRTERNLSLVSKKWYFLTQSQISTCGVHKIHLDKISRAKAAPAAAAPTATPKTVSSISYGTLARRPGVLMQRNTPSRRNATSFVANIPQRGTKPLDSTYNITLFTSIQRKLLKYKHIHIDGTLTCDEFKKLIVALDANRIEQLHLRVKIEKDRTQAKEFAVIPKQLCYLERLTLLWSSDKKEEYSNGLTWTVYNRAIKLRTLEIYLNEDDSAESVVRNRRDSVEKISTKFSHERTSDIPHRHLNKVVFNRSSNTSPPNHCAYTSLIRNVLMKEDSIYQVDTNDNKLIEHLIISSDRICTTRELRFLRFLTPIKSIDLLAQLLKSSSLGTEQLSIMTDNIDHLDEVRLAMENFRFARHEDAQCQLSLSLKDQKFQDCEDKIKNLVHLSRMSNLIININVQQRVSIDCCHLMWSINRALQSSDISGNCLIKIKLQAGPGLIKPSGTIFYSEITVPLGRCSLYKINQNLEDIARHREILKSLKKDCYHQFVKSVRENVTS